MVLHIYVDGSGSPYFRYGYFIDETGESHMEHYEGISNNEAEYLAIISALNNVVSKDSQIVLLSDSQLVVNQINHKFGINNEKLRRLAAQIWVLEKKFDKFELHWIRRSENKAGKMLGS
ncbi:MAG TPA: reverse transcriptase-like protein [Nitrososphaeraceae archaeon]|nr:reverse transcriptase-like protein [Nitrososphaeraceae archaeon]